MSGWEPCRILDMSRAGQRRNDAADCRDAAFQLARPPRPMGVRPCRESDPTNAGARSDPGIGGHGDAANGMVGKEYAVVTRFVSNPG